MTLQRMDDVGVVVDDLEAATVFFGHLPAIRTPWPERCDAQARWAELEPAYQDLAATAD
jgi:hypothetical protein